MGRITRKDLRRNELAETVTKTVGYVTHHRRGVIEAAVLVAGALLLVAGVVAFRIYRANVAGNELSAALEILATPVGPQPSVGAARTFATAAERQKEAEPHLRRAASHPGTQAGRAAAVILAAQDPKSSGAADVLARAARDGKAEVAAAAEIDAARLLAEQGKTTEAVERLKRAIESSDARAPKDALLFALGEIYERAGLAADARATYQRLVNDYPSSAYRADARSKLPNASGQPTFPNPS